MIVAVSTPYETDAVHRLAVRAPCVAPAANEVLCPLHDPRTLALARDSGNTRSAAAMHLWGKRLGGAVVAIGNAPTALFHLLEMLRDGAPKPAAID